MTWATWLLSLAQPLVVQVLLALGVGVLTVTGIDIAVNQAMSWCINAVGGMTADMVNLLALGGFFQGMSYIGGAFSARVAMAGASSIKKFFFK